MEDGDFDGTPVAITQTKDGYLWIATEAGLLRFDGVRFVPFNDLVQKSSALNGEILSLLGASDGSLWIGGRQVIYRWNGVALQTFKGRLGLFEAMVEDHAGIVWAVREQVLGERQGGLCRALGSAIACIGGPKFVSSYAVTVDADNSIWVANDKAVFRYSSGIFTTFPFSSDRLRSAQGLAGVRALVPDSEHGMWVGFDTAGHDLGLEHLQDGFLQPVRTSHFDGTGLKVASIFAGKNGSLWIGSDADGIFRISGEAVEHYGISDGLSGPGAGQFFQDREGDLWVVTAKGVDRFRDASVLTYTSTQGLRLNGADAVLASRDGSIWVPTDIGADVLRGRELPRLSERVHIPGSRGTSVLESANGDIWIGMDKELYRIANHSIVRVRGEGDIPLGNVGRMAQDRAGNIWISSFKLQADDKILSVIRPNDNVARAVVTELGMSASTVADIRSGVWVLDRSGKIAHVEIGSVQIERNAALDGKHTTTLIQGPDGTLYVWCKEGVVLIRGAVGRFVPDAQIASCQIFASIFDRSGSLWAHGRCGLIRIAKDEVADWWNHPTAPPHDRLLIGAKDRLGLMIGNFSPRLAMDPDGRLWLATGSGVQMVDPAHLYFNPVPPPVVIESLIGDHRAVSLLTSNDFSAGTRDVEIDYTALSFANPGKVMFRYKLDGHDKEWQSVGTRRNAIYTNLIPGDYSFHVQACNDSGVWNDQGASLHFSIRPFWYQTVWFRFFATFLLLCVLFGIFALRARVIEERVQIRANERMSERMRISRELHDTLLQALQGIVLRFSNLTTRLDPQIQQELDRTLDDAELLIVSGRERIKEMRGILPEGRDLTAEIQTFITGLSVSGCNAIVELRGNPVPLRSIVHEETLWIAREALSNACRHSQATRLTVQIVYTPGNFRLTIQDNGVGLPPDAFLAHYRGHFGLVTMHERAEAIGARFSVRSEDNLGTRIDLSLPSRLAYPAKRRGLMDIVA